MGFSPKEKEQEEQGTCSAALSTEMPAVYFCASPALPLLTFLPANQKLLIVGSDWEEKQFLPMQRQ